LNKKKEDIMKVEITDLGACKKGMAVEVSAEDMEERLKEHLSDFKKNVQIKGFRPGRTPSHIIERRYLKKIVEEMRETVAGEVFEEATKEKRLRVIGEPKIEEVKYERGEPLTFKAEFFVLPEIEVPPYKGLRLTKPKAEVKEEEVNEELERLRKLKAQLVDVVNRPTKEGDRILAEITVTADGKELFSTSNGYVVVGMANIFGVNVIDLPNLLSEKKQSDTVEFEFEIPEESPLAGEKKENVGKKAVCKMKILKVREVSLPELNDGFAKDYGYESLEDMKKKTAERLTVLKRLQIEDGVEERLLLSLVNSIKIELPDELLKEKAHLRGDYLREKLSAETDMSAEEIEEEVKKEVEAQSSSMRRLLISSLLTEEIAKKEGIFVTEDEVDVIVGEMARQKGLSAKELKDEMLHTGKLSELRAELLEKKVRIFLRKNAVLTEGEDFSNVEPPVEKAEEKTEEKSEKQSSEKQKKSKEKEEEDEK